MVDTLLKRYEHSRELVKLKARFLIYVYITILLLLPALMIYSLYVQLHSPANNYSINVQVIATEAVLLFAFILSFALCVRGHFRVSAHTTIIILFSAMWAVIFFDRLDVISRLDTIVMAVGILSATPIVISRHKSVVLVYAGINILLLYAFMFHFREVLNLSEGTFADYLADNTITLIFTAIVSYNILSINNRALEQAEESNAAFQRTNMELNAAMEELVASNEEYEAQNEELVRSEEALRSSETDLLAIFNSVHDAMIVFDMDGAIHDVNQRMLEMFRLGRTEALSMKITDLSARPIDAATVKRFWMEIINGRESLVEWQVRRPGDGSTIITEVGLKSFKRRGKSVLLAVVRDITLRKMAEQALKESLEEKTSLIKEIHHRVKNNMQVISSLLNMQADSAGELDAGQALKDAVGRIHSMASIHEKIYRTENFSKVDMASYIEDLSGDLAALYSGSEGAVRINRRLAPVFLGIDLAVPCGLLINEILTNAIKHGNCGVNDCVIDLELKESEGTVTVMIADNGPGMDPALFEAKRKTSMGMQIIDALARQIGATVELSVEGGTCFTIRFHPE